MARLLLIDDDRFLLRGLEKLLTAEGYFCRCAVSGAEALRLLDGDTYDLVVLDIGLPDMDGFALCRRIRARHRMPILFLTARDESADRVAGLEIGGDDYVTKPFAPRELVARVRAQLRRLLEYTRDAGETNRIEVGPIVVDSDRHDALVNGSPAGLTDREFSLLETLARHREKALAASWIFETVWGFDAETGPKTLAVYVRRLRLKLESDPERPRHLLTVRGFGYKLTAGDQ